MVQEQLSGYAYDLLLNRRFAADARRLFIYGSGADALRLSRAAEIGNPSGGMFAAATYFAPANSAQLTGGPAAHGRFPRTSCLESGRNQQQT